MPLAGVRDGASTATGGYRAPASTAAPLRRRRIGAEAIPHVDRTKVVSLGFRNPFWLWVMAALCPPLFFERTLDRYHSPCRDTVSPDLSNRSAGPGPSRSLPDRSTSCCLARAGIR